MSGMVEIIQKIVEKEMQKIHITELGVVTSIFPHTGESDKENYACNVQLKYRDLELRNVPVATHHIGWSNIPKVGDLVVMSFINGDINSPIIIGRLYNDEDRPPVSQDGEMIYEAPYSENSDLRRIHMKLPSGIQITIGDSAVNVQAGDTKLTININGDIEIEAKEKVSITSTEDMALKGKNVSIESEEALEVKAGTEGAFTISQGVTLKGMEVNIESDAAMQLKAGTTGKVEASTTFELKTVQGTLEASGPMAIKGAMVNIN